MIRSEDIVWVVVLAVFAAFIMFKLLIPTIVIEKPINQTLSEAVLDLENDYNNCTTDLIYFKEKVYDEDKYLVCSEELESEKESFGNYKFTSIILSIIVWILSVVILLIWISILYDKIGELKRKGK